MKNRRDALRTLAIALWCFVSVTAFAAKPVLLYSRYFNAEGENRYSADTTYKDVLEKLGADFEVRVHAEELTAKTLADVRLLVIANPSDKAIAGYKQPNHFSKRDIEVITTWIEWSGGGLIIMGNQENHNLDIDDTNKLLARFGLYFKNVYTDAKKLVLAQDLPIIGGLRWAYYTGNQVFIEPTHRAKPRSLVTNDLAQKPEKGPRDEPGSLLAIAEPGKGRVVVVTDAGWIANFALNEEGVGGVAIKGQDNLEIFRRLAKWAATK